MRLGNDKQHAQNFMKADIVPRVFCLKNLILLGLLYPQCKNYNPWEEMTHLNTHPERLKLKKNGTKVLINSNMEKYTNV